MNMVIFGGSFLKHTSTQGELTYQMHLTDEVLCASSYSGRIHNFSPTTFLDDSCLPLYNHHLQRCHLYIRCKSCSTLNSSGGSGILICMLNLLWHIQFRHRTKRVYFILTHQFQESFQSTRDASVRRNMIQSNTYLKCIFSNRKCCKE